MVIIEGSVVEDEAMENVSKEDTLIYVDMLKLDNSALLRY